MTKVNKVWHDTELVINTGTKSGKGDARKLGIKANEE